MNIIAIDEESFNAMQKQLSECKTLLAELKCKLEEHDPARLYNTKSLMAYLQVGEKCVRRYRESGLLRYHKAEDSDKIWYLQKDVDDFLAAITVPAYRIDGLDIPIQICG